MNGLRMIGIIQPNKEPRYYQEIFHPNNALDAIAEKQNRILTRATGTGKTVIAFHLAWYFLILDGISKEEFKDYLEYYFLLTRNMITRI